VYRSIYYYIIDLQFAEKKFYILENRTVCCIYIIENPIYSHQYFT